MHALPSGSVAIYARCASATHEEAALKHQLQTARMFIAQRGGQPDEAQVFTDVGPSAVGQRRPGLTAMLEAAESGHVQVIVTDDPSRIARNEAVLVQFRDNLRVLNIVLVYINS
jgi:DNA invertase Pin-like site-specific DNA recombinase